MATPEKPGGRRGSKPMSDLRDKFSNQFDGTDLDTAGPSSDSTGEASSPTGNMSSSDRTTTPSALPSDAGEQSLGTQSGPGTQDESGGLASGIRQFVKDTTYEQLGTQKQRATEGLGSIAEAVRGATQPLRDSGQAKTADYINTAADQIEQLSSTLRERDLQQLLKDLERFARRQPAVFIGTAFGIGLLAARFLKSSGQRGGSRTRYNQGGNRTRSNYDSDRSGS